MLTFKRVLSAALPALLVSMTACATIEDGADHARDFMREHRAVSAVAAAVIGAGVAAAVRGHRPHAEPEMSNAPRPAPCNAPACFY
jgi:hypothetical protein